MLLICQTWVLTDVSRSENKKNPRWLFVQKFTKQKTSKNGIQENNSLDRKPASLELSFCGKELQQLKKYVEFHEK